MFSTYCPHNKIHDWMCIDNSIFSLSAQQTSSTSWTKGLGYTKLVLAFNCNTLRSRPQIQLSLVQLQHYDQGVRHLCSTLIQHHPLNPTTQEFRVSNSLASYKPLQPPLNLKPQYKEAPSQSQLQTQPWKTKTWCDPVTSWDSQQLWKDLVSVLHLLYPSCLS